MTLINSLSETFIDLMGTLTKNFLPRGKQLLFLTSAVLLVSCGGGTTTDKASSASALSPASENSSEPKLLGVIQDSASLSSASTASCSLPAWTAGRPYVAGNVVKYSSNGKYYKATHDNPGYDPTISTWYWDSYTCNAAPPASSNFPSWTSGQPYVAGNIVKYSNGKYYKASHDNPGYDPTVSTWYWDIYVDSSPAPTSGGFVVTEAQFNKMFPNRNGFYTYSGLVTALNAYPGIFNTGADTVKKQEAAAFLANVNHESGGLQYTREVNQANWPHYCASSGMYPCAAGQQYYGRGPLQLSWNYNYGAAGDALGINLLADPDMVARDATVAWKTAIWFWMTQSGGAAATPHNSMVNGLGFSGTIRSINGGLECGKAAGSVGNNEMKSRVNFYQNFVKILGVPPGSNLSC